MSDIINKIINNSKDKALALKLIDEYKKQLKGGLNKKIDSENLKGIFEKHYKKEMGTNKALELSGISKGSYFRYYKQWKTENQEQQEKEKGNQVEELKGVMEEQEGYKACNICKVKKPLSMFVKNGLTKTGIQKYRPTCKDCL